MVITTTIGWEDSFQENSFFTKADLVFFSKRLATLRPANQNALS